MYTKSKARAFDKLKQQSIKHKLIIIIMAACIVTVCLSTMAFMSSGVYQIKQQLKEDLQTLAKAVGDRNAAALAFEELNLINIDLSLLSSNESIKTACIYNNKDGILTSYSTDPQAQGYCPQRQSANISFSHDSLVLFYDIQKKGEVIGHIFIKSDLKRLDNYIQNLMITALNIIFCIIIVSYLIAVRLQGMIHNPIVNLMEDARIASAGKDYSARVRKLYHDEVGSIADMFNSILEKIDQKNKEFTQKSSELEIISKKTEFALEYFSNEFRNPFHAANSFRELMKNQVFGPVNPKYLDYFNDICSADIELYCIVNKVMALHKVQAEIYGGSSNAITADEIVSNIRKKYFNDNEPSNISFEYNIVDLPDDLFFKQIVKLFVDNIMSIFFNSTNPEERYTIKLEIRNNPINNALNVTARFTKELTNPAHMNDNFNNLQLDQLVNSIKNFEDLLHTQEESIINFNNMVIRGQINMINFLSTINNSPVIASIANNSIAFTLTFPWEDAVKQTA
jgi:hypothetical protein